MGWVPGVQEAGLRGMPSRALEQTMDIPVCDGPRAQAICCWSEPAPSLVSLEGAYKVRGPSTTISLPRVSLLQASFVPDAGFEFDPGQRFFFPFSQNKDFIFSLPNPFLPNINSWENSICSCASGQFVSLCSAHTLHFSHYKQLCSEKICFPSAKLPF